MDNVKKDYFLLGTIVLADPIGRLVIYHLPLTLGGQQFCSVILWSLISLLCLQQLQETNQMEIWRVERPRLMSILWTVVGFFALYYWLVTIARYIPTTENETRIDTVYASLSGLSKLGYILWASLLGPIVEEVIYRGWVMKRFEKWSRYGLSCLWSAFLFALGHMHGFRPLEMLPYFGMGLIFAFLFQKTKKIYAPMILHIVWNTLVTIANL
ncbi:CPBP family intramembrane metalloprotease [Streptococcus suis]|uniref:CPBP family intramembrane metalloprotease n=1 Tax=Streptococcus suis TaxID=1307 RepID=A0A3R8SS37_STRSU|nr:CPBP family intramembrane glutamic endopeptidase [Streptococcus suis]RRR47585.1 CPBP family intramembrane metalloprotease [Streptococcus suis]